LLVVISGEESDGSSLGTAKTLVTVHNSNNDEKSIPSTAGTTNTMDVILRVIGVTKNSVSAAEYQKSTRRKHTQS
jgi:hypothetical protein